jgi:hypothetical protein
VKSPRKGLPLRKEMKNPKFFGNVLISAFFLFLFIDAFTCPAFWIIGIPLSSVVIFFHRKASQGNLSSPDPLSKSSCADGRQVERKTRRGRVAASIDREKQLRAARLKNDQSSRGLLHRSRVLINRLRIAFWYFMPR